VERISARAAKQWCLGHAHFFGVRRFDAAFVFSFAPTFQSKKTKAAPKRRTPK
jgi:hypothetical protein